MTREMLGFAMRDERRADKIACEIADIRRELNETEEVANSLRKRAHALRQRALPAPEIEIIQEMP